MQDVHESFEKLSALNRCWKL